MYRAHDCAGGVFFVEAELGVVVDVDGEHAHLVGVVWGDCRHDDFVDGTGENEASVVVGVFAD